MAISPIVSANPSALQSATTSATGGSALDQNAFLKLLVTQMTNQDPTAPQDQSQMLAQLAQFSQVQSLNSVQSTQSQLQATALLGKTVTANATVNNVVGSVTGLVTNVAFNNGGVSLTVQGASQPVQMSDITQVSN